MNCRNSPKGWSRCVGQLVATACALTRIIRAERLINTFGRNESFTSNCSGILCAAKSGVNQQLCDLAAAIITLPVIATNGVQYARPSGRQVLDVFTCIREHTHLDAAGKLLTQNAERHLKSDAEMRALFRDLPEAITNTERLADRLTFSLENIGYAFPDFPVPDGHNMDSFLRTITLFGAQQRYDAMSTAVKRQLEEELALITKLGFCRLFPDRLGHREFLPRAQHHGAGPRQRGEQRGLLLPRDHAGRSGEQPSRLRAFPERKPERLAGHRSRSAERRSARERDPGNLSPLRQARRGDDGERDHLSRQKRGARDRQGAELCAQHSRSLLASVRERRFPAHAGSRARKSSRPDCRKRIRGCRRSSRSTTRSTACRATSGSTPAA